MHKVRMSMPERELNRADATFTVEQDGKRLGTLRVSNGSLVWFPRNTRKGYKMGWSRFDEVMQRESRRVEMR